MSDLNQKTIGEIKEFVEKGIKRARYITSGDSNAKEVLDQLEFTWRKLQSDFLKVSVCAASFNYRDEYDTKYSLSCMRAEIKDGMTKGKALSLSATSKTEGNC